jgi:hypothetical protein
MKKLLLLTALSGTLIFTAGSLRAQDPPAGPPPGGPGMGPDDGPGGPFRHRMEILGFGEMHPGKVVTGAPYGAVAVTTNSQTLSDGNTINRKVQTTVFRDSQGRTRRETNWSAAGPLATSGAERSFIMIHDPVAATAFVLHPDTKVAEQLPPPRGNKKNPDDLQSRFDAHIQQEIANGSLKKEDLGTQTVNGVSAQGTRYTRTIPAGKDGNTNPIVITSEEWYSPELQVLVKSVHTDPRMGQRTYNLTNLQRTEPAATLFAVPSGYTVSQAPARGHGKGPGGPPPAPAEVQ